MVKRVDVSEFKSHVQRREGTNRRAQENYLVRVLKSMVAECVKCDMNMSDENVLKVLGVTDMECVYMIANESGNIYSAMAKSLLDNPDYRLDVIRGEVTKRIHDRIEQEVKIQQEANV